MKILDACCGSKMFWFDKDNPLATFMDIREEELTFLDRGRERVSEVKPDVVADFRNMPFEDNEFDLVVFDPPHLLSGGDNSWLVKKYGRLDKKRWKKDISQGFDECMRVLKTTGTLVFKWSDIQIPVNEVLKTIKYKPLLGDKRGKTRWLVFIKVEEVE